MYCLVDQDGLMPGDESGPFRFATLALAKQAAVLATRRVGGRFSFRAERYEAHTRMRDEIVLPDLPPEGVMPSVSDNHTSVPDNIDACSHVDALPVTRGGEASKSPAATRVPQFRTARAGEPATRTEEPNG